MDEPTTEAGRRLYEADLHDFDDVPIPREWKARAILAIEAEARLTLDVERLTRAIDGWFSDGTESWRLVPMTSDGGLSVTTPASWLAEAIAAAYATPEESKAV